MTLTQLRHLLLLEKTRSFTRAAEAAFLTQPALSRSIRTLETELGMPLFDRIGHDIEPTPFGRDILARAARLVADADDLVAFGPQSRAAEAGRIRIGLGSGPGAMIAVPLLATFARQHPGFHVEIARGHTGGLVQGLRGHLLDALVIDARVLAPAPDLRTVILSEMRGAFLCRHGHPLTDHRGPLTFDAIRRYPIASIPLSDEIARRLVERYGPQAHPGVCVTLQCEEIADLVEVARTTDAVLLSIRAAAPDLAELPMSPMDDALARFGLVTLAGRSEAPGLEVVTSIIRHHLRDPEPGSGRNQRRNADLR